MAETIFDVLMHEHEETKSMMEQLSERYDRRTFERMAKAIEKHMEAEEHVLYEKVRDEESVHSMILEGFEEHRVATSLLRRLIDQKPDTDLWMARMKVFMDVVEHHIEEEETQLFPELKAMLPKEQTQAMAVEFETAKKRVPAHV